MLRGRAERPFVVGLVIAAVFLGFDQLTKQWALDALFLDGSVIRVNGFFNLFPVWNRGVSFGLFANDHAIMPYLLSGFALLVTLALLIWLWRAETRILVLGLGMVIGGAIGNVIDRLRFGAVIDFIDWHVAGYHWPAFNIADVGVTLGVAFLLLDGFTNTSNDADP